MPPMLIPPILDVEVDMADDEVIEAIVKDDMSIFILLRSIKYDNACVKAFAIETYIKEETGC